MLSPRFTIPSRVSADEERVSSYWATSEGLREGDGVGQPICRPLVAAVQFWAGPSLAPLRSLCAVIPDALEGTPRRLDGTADRGGRSRTDDNPSRTARRVRPRVDH